MKDCCNTDNKKHNKRGKGFLRILQKWSARFIWGIIILILIGATLVRLLNL